MKPDLSLAQFCWNRKLRTEKADRQFRIKQPTFALPDTGKALQDCLFMQLPALPAVLSCLGAQRNHSHPHSTKGVSERRKGASTKRRFVLSFPCKVPHQLAEKYASYLIIFNASEPPYIKYMIKSTSWLWKITINIVVIRTHKSQMLSTEKHLFHWSFLRVGFVLGNFSERETHLIKAHWPISPVEFSHFPAVHGPETDSTTRWLGHLPGIQETQVQSLSPNQVDNLNLVLLQPREMTQLLGYW